MEPSKISGISENLYLDAKRTKQINSLIQAKGKKQGQQFCKNEDTG